jgi:hypothetical protein
VCEARLRHAQGPKSYIVSASQGLISLTTARPCGARQEVLPPAARSCRAPCLQVGALRGRQGAQHHCFPVRPGQWHQSVGKAGTAMPSHHTSARLRIVLDGYLRQLLHAPTTATRFAPCGLHKAAFCKVVASHYAKAALGVVHRLRALTGLQNGPYAKWPSLGTGASPCGRCDRLASVSCFASVQVSGLWPVITR